MDGHDLFGKGAQAMLRAPQPTLAEAVLTHVINELASIPEQIILALDDYHLTDSQTVHDALTFLIENLPPKIHLVLTTREDPLMPITLSLAFVCSRLKNTTPGIVIHSVTNGIALIPLLLGILGVMG
jgi:hypothetical protein